MWPGWLAGWWDGLGWLVGWGAGASEGITGSDGGGGWDISGTGSVISSCGSWGCACVLILVVPTSLILLYPPPFFFSLFFSHPPRFRCKFRVPFFSSPPPPSGGCWSEVVGLKIKWSVGRE